MSKLVFPAYAGMIPSFQPIGVEYKGVPRIRGDDPATAAKTKWDKACSPHTRG